MKLNLPAKLFRLSSRKRTQTSLFVKACPCLFRGMKSRRISSYKPSVGRRRDRPPFLLTPEYRNMRVFRSFTPFFSGRKIFQNFTFTLFLFTFFSCQTNKTPISPDVPKYTSHDYEWKVDTLQAPGALQILMSGVWGTDENNVWVVGHSDDYRYQLWYWDGTSWDNIPLWFPGHPNSLTAIYGFSEDDIWIVGTDIQNYPDIILRDFIIHYNGNEWEHITGLNAPLCLSVWGNDPNNIFIGCDSGIVLYYDGTQWTKQSTSTLSRILSIQGSLPTQVYAAGWTIDHMPYDTTFYYFYKYDGNSWEVVDTYMDYPFATPGKFGYKLWLSPNGKLYSVGDDGLYVKENNRWLRIRDEQLFAVHGTGWNNVFIGGWANQILHFNGQNWFKYKEFTDGSIFISNIWCNDKYVFVIARPYFQTLIYRGTVN